jgi:hypothetical protein
MLTGWRRKALSWKQAAKRSTEGESKAMENMQSGPHKKPPLPRPPFPNTGFAEEFEHFWKAYPTDLDPTMPKKLSFAAWQVAVRAAKPADLIEAARLYGIWLKAQRANNSGSAPWPLSPERFLKEERWHGLLEQRETIIRRSENPHCGIFG